jgi:hypothetical protein
MSSFRDVNRNGDAHFRSHTSLAPYFESRVDIFRPFAHPAEAPVRIAPLLNGFRIDSAAIVANDYEHEVALVFNFHFDFGRFGVT